MRPARAVACERMGCRPNDPRIGGHWYECDELTVAIEARDREVVEATIEEAWRKVAALPVYGIATVPYAAALRAAIDAIRSLAPLSGGTNGD